MVEVPCSSSSFFPVEGCAPLSWRECRTSGIGPVSFLCYKLGAAGLTKCSRQHDIISSVVVLPSVFGCGCTFRCAVSAVFVIQTRVDKIVLPTLFVPPPRVPMTVFRL